MLKLNYTYALMILTSCFASLHCMDEKNGAEKLSNEQPAAISRPPMAPLNPRNVTLTQAQYDGLLARVSQGPAKIIGQNAIHSVQMKAYRYREALLPALFVWCYINLKIINQSSYLQEKIGKIAEIYNQNKAVARTLPNKTILSVMHAGLDDRLIAGDLQNPETDYTKIIGRKLRHKEIAIIGYADGAHEIQLSDIDRDAANDLTHEQIDFLVKLKQSPTRAEFINAEPYRSTFLSLPLNMQQNLIANYNIPPSEQPISDTIQKKQEELQAINKEIAVQKLTLTWKKYGYPALACAATFALGWFSKSYWGSILSWFSGKKTK